MDRLQSDVVEAIIANARRRPSPPALRIGLRRITYAELLDRALAFAAILRDHDSKRASVCLPKGLDACAWLLACIVSRTTYCPVSADAPAERIQLYLQQTSPDVFVSDGRLGLRNRSITLLTPDKWETKEAFKLGDNASDDDSLAYIIMTSGSTGVPKAIGIPRSCLAWFLDHATSLIDASSSDVWSQQPNLGFDLSLFDILGSWRVGAELVSPATSFDRLFPARWIEANSISVWQSVPAVLRSMIASGDVERGKLASLRAASFCGEPLLLEHCRVLARFSSARVFNTYGPTETTVFCFGGEVTSADLVSQDVTAPLGVAFPGVVWRVDGGSTTGELVLSGAGVQRTYVNSESIPDSGFSVADSGSLEYRTGDFVRVSGERVHFEGRMDKQTKASGVRIELGEIEHWLAVLGYPLTCVVQLGDSLGAAIEGVPDRDAGEIATRLRDFLPVQCIPRPIRFFDSLPLNVNDKIDANAVRRLLEAQVE